MKNDISLLLNKVQSDWVTGFFSQFSFELHAFGEWNVKDVRILKNHIIGDFEIIYIKEGRVELTIGEVSYICSQGDIVLIEPFKVYSVKCLDNRVRHYYFHFDISPVYLQDEFLKVLLGDKGNIIRNKLVDFMPIYNFIQNEVDKREQGYYEMVRASFIQLFIYILRISGETSKIYKPIIKNKLSRDVVIVNESINIISNKIGNPIKIGDISKELHVSENYIYKSFIRVVKMSPNKYIQQYRIKKAEQLLKTKEFTLEEIALKLGYSSMFHLSASFKKAFEISPREYMKKLNM